MIELFNVCGGGGDGGEVHGCEDTRWWPMVVMVMQTAVDREVAHAAVAAA